MKIHQVALQLYTIRDQCKTPSDLADSLKKVRAIGYQAVQVSGICALPETELNRILADNGLVCCATHESGNTILNEPEKVADHLQKLGCMYTAYPYPNPNAIDLSKPDQVARLIAGLDAAGAVLKKHGQVLCYHNHALEFYRLNGQTILDRIYNETKPDHLQGELDTYWVQHGGGDSVAWCRKLKGRLPLLHLKDYAVNATGHPTFAEIGAGQLDFPRPRGGGRGERL